MTEFKYDTAWTHAGVFHADDVFSAALLRILNPALHIHRNNQPPKDLPTQTLLFDIGKGAFDHHQEGAAVRENGVPYAAFGLLWNEFGAVLLGAEEALRFDAHFIQPLDLDDNTGCGHPLASVVQSFNPPWDSAEDPDLCFEEACGLAASILRHKFQAIAGILRAKSLVEKAYREMENNIVILPQFAPWKNVLIDTDAAFLIYPSQRGGYSAQSVPESRNSNALKFPFPAEWAGKTPEELAICSGIPGLQFCHNSLFLISTNTIEEAILACKCTGGCGIL